MTKVFSRFGVLCLSLGFLAACGQSVRVVQTPSRLDRLLHAIALANEPLAFPSLRNDHAWAGKCVSVDRDHVLWGAAMTLDKGTPSLTFLGDPDSHHEAYLAATEFDIQEEAAVNPSSYLAIGTLKLSTDGKSLGSTKPTTSSRHPGASLFLTLRRGKTASGAQALFLRAVCTEAKGCKISNTLTIGRGYAAFACYFSHDKSAGSAETNAKAEQDLAHLMSLR